MEGHLKSDIGVYKWKDTWNQRHRRTLEMTQTTPIHRAIKYLKNKYEWKNIKNVVDVCIISWSLIPELFLEIY